MPIIFVRFTLKDRSHF